MSVGKPLAYSAGIIDFGNSYAIGNESTVFIVKLQIQICQRKKAKTLRRPSRIGYKFQSNFHLHQRSGQLEKEVIP